MKNHVYLIAIPEEKDGLQRVLKPVHMRYAQYINRQHKWSGHLWQGRFFSSPLDEAYLWFCVRYVERNPVRAGMVERAEQYPWSSAAARCGLKEDKLITTNTVHWKQFENIIDWSGWLNELDDEKQLNIVQFVVIFKRTCLVEQMPFKGLENTGQKMKFRPIGRPKKG